jgi:hypothetical protein
LTRKKKISEAICSATKLFSAVNLLPLDSVQEGEEEDISGSTRINLLRIVGYVEWIVLGLTNRQFQMHFRVSRFSLEKFVPIIVDMIKKETAVRRPRIDTQKQSLRVLWLLTTPDSGVSELGPVPEIILAQIYRPPSIPNPGTA